MSDRYSKKRKYSKDYPDNIPVKRLSDLEHMTVERHMNSICIGTVIRLLGSSSNTKGRLATAY